MLCWPFSWASTLRGCSTRASWAAITMALMGRRTGRQAVIVLMEVLYLIKEDCVTAKRSMLIKICLVAKSTEHTLMSTMA